MSRHKLAMIGFAIVVLVAASFRIRSHEHRVLRQIYHGEESLKPVQTMAYVTSKDGTKIAFEQSGAGPAIIIVSGALSARSLFVGEPRSLVEMLSKHFTVFIYDRRGRGESTDVKPYAVQREIEDLESLIDNAAKGHAYVYGVSSGAALSLLAAGKLGPDKIQKLAIFEPPYGQGKEPFEMQKQGVNERVKTGKPGDAAAFFLLQIRTPKDAIENMKSSPIWKTFEKIDFTLAYDYQVLGDGEIPKDVAKAISVPTLVMDGEKSLPFMHATAEQLTTLIPNAQHKPLTGQMHQAKAEVVAPVLIEFFK